MNETLVAMGTAMLKGEMTERQEKAMRLHGQIIANEKIVAQSLIELCRDLKIMRDEKLYTEFGCESFGDYCSQRAGIKERQGYNFVAVFEKFGERLSELQDIGITKLLEVAKLDDEDAEELIASGELEEMSVRELKAKCEEYKHKYEQLTLDYEEKLEVLDSRNNVLEENVRLKGELAEATKKNESMLDNLALVNKSAEMIKREKEQLEEKIKELESKPVDVAVQKPSKEEIQKIKDKAKKDAEKAASEAFEVEKKKLNEEISYYRKEIVKLESEKEELQSSAKKPPLDDTKAKVKFYLGECQKDFNAALEAIDEINSDEERGKLRTAMNKIVEQMKATLE